jgi:Secretion system C-terminal sorting domain
VEENGPISRFEIFPNPSSEPVTLFIESERNAIVEMQVYDFSGKLLLSRELQIKQGANEELVDTDLPGAGSYLVILRHETGSHYRKLIRIP